MSLKAAIISPFGVSLIYDRILYSSSTEITRVEAICRRYGVKYVEVFETFYQILEGLPRRSGHQFLVYSIGEGLSHLIAKFKTASRSQGKGWPIQGSPG